jgi:NDP-sugar pyrophosphorylase family protein
MDIDAEGRIHRFLNTKIDIHQAGPLRKLMFTGVQILEAKVFDYMDAHGAEEKFSTTRQTYPEMLLAGEPLYGFCFEGFWQDLGTLERISQAEACLAQGRVRLHYLP